VKQLTAELHVYAAAVAERDDAIFALRAELDKLRAAAQKVLIVHSDYDEFAPMGLLDREMEALKKALGEK
jgi:iron-sulfur cluster repair protein YtfE (RIC family)